MRAENFFTWLENRVCYSGQCGKVPGGLVRPLSRKRTEHIGETPRRACYVRRSGRFGWPAGQPSPRLVRPLRVSGKGGEL